MGKNGRNLDLSRLTLFFYLADHTQITAAKQTKIAKVIIKDHETKATKKDV